MAIQTSDITYNTNTILDSPYEVEENIVVQVEENIEVEIQVVGSVTVDVDIRIMI
tara:strand:- start:499 stop:663 length:165 start_codon:yes stop_codon:yes gene_type:complete